MYVRKVFQEYVLSIFVDGLCVPVGQHAQQYIENDETTLT